MIFMRISDTALELPVHGCMAIMRLLKKLKPYPKH